MLLAPIWERPSLAAADADGLLAGDLGGLLGTTRARVIRAVAAGCTTTELARARGIAPATASEHASALRKSGLSAGTACRKMLTIIPVMPYLPVKFMAQASELAGWQAVA